MQISICGGTGSVLGWIFRMNSYCFTHDTPTIHLSNVWPVCCCVVMQWSCGPFIVLQHFEWLHHLKYNTFISKYNHLFTDVNVQKRANINFKLIYVLCIRWKPELYLSHCDMVFLSISPARFEYCVQQIVWTNPEITGSAVCRTVCPAPLF